LTTTATPLAPPDRGIRHFTKQQTPWSWAALFIGILALLLPIVATILILTAHGWTQECPEGVERTVCSPTDPLVKGLISPELGVVAFATIGVGAAAALLSFSQVRRVPNKHAREAAIAGAVLGLQAMALALVFLWFRGSNVDRFARNFLDIRLFAEFFDRFVNGAKNTLILSIAGAALGFALGLILRGQYLP